MSIVEVDSRFRVTIPAKIRKKANVTKGQNFYLIPLVDGLLMKPVPKNPSRKLDELLGNFKFDRKARRRAGEWFRERAQKS